LGRVRFNTPWYSANEFDDVPNLTAQQLAWEYLRRNPVYVEDWLRERAGAASSWSLVHLEDPARDVQHASPQWIVSVQELTCRPPPTALSSIEGVQHRQRLRLLDRHAKGDSLRTIAEGFLGRERVQAAWHADSALRAHLRYQLHRAQALRDGGYRALLRPCVDRRSPEGRACSSPCSTALISSTTVRNRSEADALGLTWPQEMLMPSRTLATNTVPVRYLDTTEAATRLNLSPRTLEKLRVIGGGPRFCKFRRRVRYALTDLDEWACERVYESTSDPGYAQR
jgi:hypothetical protein